MRIVVFVHNGQAFDPVPDETHRRDIDLRSAAPRTGSFAIVGWKRAGEKAAAMAARYGDRVDRLVLCATPIPTDEKFELKTITAKTLLLFGAADPDAPSKAARWWKNQISGARVEMVPRAGSEIITTFWKRVLSHSAPGSGRTSRN